MRFIADFHIHSKYSRATSREMEIPILSEYAKRKGINLLGTGDFTHPVWLQELKKYLKPTGTGLFTYNSIHFILTTEVCNIFYQKGPAKKVHNIIFAPGFETADKINRKLMKYGKLLSDGRPILSLSAQDLLKIVLEIDPDCYIVPGHIWTPWFSLFGSNSGFDDIYECFGELTKYIYTLETGLSSDPGMNWRCSMLDRFSLISNSDAHSPSKIGRESNIFDTELAYDKIIDALKKKDKDRFLGTIEFFPQEGKYHWDGHRSCNISQAPKDSIASNNICPVCRRPLTVGVMHRVETLCDRPSGVVPDNTIPYHSLVPLAEIMAQVQRKQADSVSIKTEFNNLTSMVGTEFDILMELSEEELYRKLPKDLATAIVQVRKGKVKVTPGYDGVFGKVGIALDTAQKEGKQLQLF